MKKKIGQESIPTLLLETLLLVLCVFDTSAICNLPFGYELEFQKLFYLILPAYICSFKKQGILSLMKMRNCFSEKICHLKLHLQNSKNAKI